VISQRSDGVEAMTARPRRATTAGNVKASDSASRKLNLSKEGTTVTRDLSYI
jgi:hypothetical protein